MFLISTVLYFGEDPVGYILSRENDEFIFTPAIHKHCKIKTPVITARLEEDKWIIKEMEDRDIQDQVIRIINLNSLISLPNTLSAAS